MIFNRFVQPDNIFEYFFGIFKDFLIESNKKISSFLLKSNQVTEIGAFMVRTNLASEFEFPA